MNYDGLQRQYWQSQLARVLRLRERIACGTSTATGRVVPAQEDLAIGQGRRLKMAVMFLDISSFLLTAFRKRIFLSMRPRVCRA